jgi:anti-sigma-K factor RskA
MSGPAEFKDDSGPGNADDALAGEYTLGVLDAADRAAVEHRIKDDPAFAALVTRWEMQFADMNDGFAKAVVPDLLPGIEARLFGQPEARANAAAPALAGWWARFVGGAGLAFALAIAALIFASPPLPPTPAGSVLTATLAVEGSPLMFAARFVSATGALTVERTGGAAADAGQVHELWLIADEAAPVPLGLIGAGPLVRSLPALPEGAILAISLEPEGGSPTGAPTGPVLVTGIVAGDA